MGCLNSKTAHLHSPDDPSAFPDADKPGLANGDDVDQECQVPVFKDFGLNELRRATNEFRTNYIVSESGEKAPNVVYKGKLENNRLVVIKRFSKQSWPNAQQFMEVTLSEQRIKPYSEAILEAARWGRSSIARIGCLSLKQSGRRNGEEPNPKKIVPLLNDFLSIAARFF